MRVAVIAAAICLSVVGAAGAGDVIAAIRKPITIGPQPLGSALQELARDRDFQLVCNADLVRGLKTRGISGQFTPGEALATLLTGTGLAYQYLDARTVTVVPLALQSHRAGSVRPPNGPSSPTASDTGAKEGKNSSSSGFRLAQVAQGAGSGTRSVKSPNQASGTEEFPELQEITVTAQKYSQRAFDVPISLDVIEAQELQRLNITSLNELQYDVPGLYVMGGNVYNYIVLRGVSNESGNGALVGEYIDEADVSAEGYAGESGYGTGDLPLYDLDRVEVLKGPQGTLYGDGAMGGVIRYITNKPALGRYEMSTDVSALFTQYGAPSQRTEAMLNIPLVGNALAFRIAGQFQHDGGWVDEPVANLKNINGINLTDVRLEALWQPSALFKALVTQVIHREDYGIGSGETAQGDIIPAFGLTVVPNGEQSFNLSNLTVTADFPIAQLVSSSTYLKHTETTNSWSFAASPEIGIETFVPLGNQTYSEELRLHSVTLGPWQWTLGGFYKHYQDNQAASEYYGLVGPLSAATYYQLIGNSDQSNDRAVFADTSFNFLERFTFGTGIRYFKSGFSVRTQGAMVDNLPVAPPSAAQEGFTSTDPRFYVQYRLSSHVNTYASAAKGFRSGEPNLGLYLGFDPESLWSYDLGTKMRFLQGRLRSDADVFYERYSNYVGEGLVTVYGVPEYGPFNIGAARIKGVDADVEWSVGAQWLFSAKAEAVNSEFATITAGDTGFMPGERVPFVPAYTFTGSIEREFHWADKPGFALVNYSQTGRVNGYESPVVPSDLMHFLSFKIGVRWNPSLRMALFGQNLLNDRGYLDPDWNEDQAYRPRPRTFGVEFGVNFD